MIHLVKSSGRVTNGENMYDPKHQIEKIIEDIENGRIPAEKAWYQVKQLKEAYVKILGQQSWNSYIGHRFQGLIYSILKGYVNNLVIKDAKFKGLDVLTEGETKQDEVIKRKLAIEYGDYLLMPDVDSVIVWKNDKHQWESVILAIVSCKTSLRERIAQSCYWKLKLLSSDFQKGIHVYLVTSDNDKDFSIDNNTGRFNGKSRDRIISEYELDGVYVLKEDFRSEWESDKIKRFNRIFADILQLATNKTKC